MGTEDVFAVIAEGTRRQILETLRDGDRAVGELVIELQVSQPTVSKHLKVLREAGLVAMRAQGQKRYYSLEAGPLDHLRGWLAGFDVEPIRADVVAGQGAMDSERATSTDGPAVSEDAGVTQSSVDPRAGLLAVAVLAGTVGDTDAGADASGSGTREGDPSSIGDSGVSAAGTSVDPAVTTPESDAVRPIGRTMGRAAERAADLLSQLRRRRDPTS